MITQQRRGFLKLISAAAGALALARYAEPFVAVADTHRDWIEDNGDYLVVRVPDFKTFANETLKKPVIFLLGQQAIVRHVDVAGFVNLFSPKGGIIYGSCFDCSQMVTENKRPVAVVMGDGLIIDSCHLICSGNTAISVEPYKPRPQIFNNYSI